jgi:SAM-dependent methyltransferase
MTEFWEAAFAERQLMWGFVPTESARVACERFAKSGVKDVLIPGMGYGRNAKVFLEQGMNVTGIEISETAIALARTHGLTFPIHHGSVLEMPFDDATYDSIFCFGMLYLLDAEGRAKHIRDCHRQLRSGGEMVFTLISKEAPMYAHGKQLGEDWYERHPGLPMFFYDERSITREFAEVGLVEITRIDEPAADAPLPFLQVVCRKA